MTIENVKKRIDYLDAAKGIAILAVIVGHFYAPGVIGRIIYSFHLPLFFIISGYCIKDYRADMSFMHSARGLLIPYVIGTSMEMVAEALYAKDFSSGLNGIKHY